MKVRIRSSKNKDTANISLKPVRRRRPRLESEDKIPTKPSAFDLFAYNYDRWFEKEGRLIFSIESQAIKIALPNLDKPWLEIGVGSGRFAQALDIDTGLDPSIELLHMARRRGITAFLGRGEEKLFDEHAFGSVFLIMTLPFVDSPSAILKEAHRILVPNGKLVIASVLRDNPWGQLYESKKSQGHRLYKHATFYNYDEVTALLQKANFKLQTTVSTLFQLPGNVQRLEASKRGFYQSAGFTVIVASKCDNKSNRK